MNALRQLWFRFTALFRHRNLEAEMAEEMRQHLERRTQEKIADGMAPDEARYAAQREFGGVEQIKESARDGRGFVWLEQCAQDLRYAARQLRRAPGFAATAIGILALGVGATTAIFSVVHGLMLKPLPYDEPGQLVEVFETSAPGRTNSSSPGVYLDFREQAVRFEAFAAFERTNLNFTDSGAPERLAGLRMTADALRLLRARPVLGRVFAPDEDQPGRDKVIVLAHQLWQQRYAADPGAIGRTTTVHGEPHTIIGVLPPGFLPEERMQYVVPYAFGPKWREERGSHWLRIYARLRPGVTLEQGNEELAAIVQRNRALFPAWKKDWSVTIRPLDAVFVQEVKPALLVLLGAVALVLLIACANVASLLLARAMGRRKEIALRAALGAGRGRIVRQLLAESLALAGLGALGGLALASWFTALLRQAVAAMNYPRAHEIALDGTVLAVALSVALATGFLFGLVPALQASRPDLNDALKDAARGSGSGGARLRGALIVGEVALALVLLAGAGLLIRSFVRAAGAPAGFEPAGVLTAQLSVAGHHYADAARRAAFFQAVAERVAALPGVESAGLSSNALLRSGFADHFFLVPGRAGQPEPGYPADFEVCTPDYLRALHVPLLRGRHLAARDFSGPARTAVINETMARRVFPGENPLGQRLLVGSTEWEIVGVVGDVRTRSLTRVGRPAVYWAQAWGPAWQNAGLVVRTTVPPATVADAVRRAIHEIDPAQPVAHLRTLDDVVADSLGQRRLTLVLLALFAGAALLLAAVGLYGVIAYATAQRTREFGIRLALGATGRDVVAVVLRHGLALLGLGLAIGLAGAFALTRLIASLLYETEPTDPVAFAGVVLLLLATTLLACWLPARRAAKVDPMVALRCE